MPRRQAGSLGQRSRAPEPPGRPRAWTVYLLRCADGTLYCGCTTDLARRLKEHSEGRGARYTRGRGPLKLSASRKHLTRGEALSLEAAVKRMPRDKKAAFLAAGGAGRRRTS